MEIETFPDGEIDILLMNGHGEDMFVKSTIAPYLNLYLMELFTMQGIPTLKKSKSFV